MDTATSDIRVVEFTPSSDGPSRGFQENHCRAADSPILPELLGQIPENEQIRTVTADGAYDTRPSRDFALQNPAGNGCHAAITERLAVPIIPIRKNGRAWKEDCPAAKARNETLRATKYYGRAFWKHWTGYHARSRVEAKMRGIKAFGERIAARDPDRQTADDNMIVEIDVNGLARARDVAGHANVSLAGCHVAGRMIVNEDHGSSRQFQRPFGNLARINRDVINSATGLLFVRDDDVTGIQE